MANGHVARGQGMATTILQGTVPGGRKPRRQKLRWEENIRDWTKLTIAKSTSSLRTEKLGEH